MPDNKQFTVKIKTEFDGSGVNAATQAESKLAAATKGYSAEQRRAIELQQKLVAASQGSREGIFGLAKEVTGLTGSLGKAIPFIGAFFTGWSIGQNLFEKHVSPWLNKVIGYVEKMPTPITKTVAALEALNKVRMEDLTKEMEALSTSASTTLARVEQLLGLQQKLREAQAEFQVAKLMQTEADTPERAARIDAIRGGAKAAGGAADVAAFPQRAAALDAQQKALEAKVTEAEARAAKSESEYQSIKTQAKLDIQYAMKYGTPTPTGIIGQSEDARRTAQADKAALAQTRAATAPELSKIAQQRSDMNIQRQASEYSAATSAMAIPTPEKAAQQYALNRVAKEKAEAETARANYAKSPTAALAAEAQKQQAEFQNAVSVLQQIMSGNTQKLQQLVDWMKKQDAKVKNLPTS